MTTVFAFMNFSFFAAAAAAVGIIVVTVFECLVALAPAGSQFEQTKQFVFQ